MAEKTFEQELADIENQLGLPIPNDQKQKLLARKQEILSNPQYRYAKAHGLSTAKTPNATEIQESNTDYENLADKNIGVLNNTPQAPKENYSDVDDQKAVGATKEELDYMLQNGQISRAAYEKQIAALQTPEVQEKIAEGEKKADETDWDPSKRPDNFQLGEKVNGEGPDPENGGTSPKEEKAKNKYRNQSMSIWDAYYNGEFGDPDSDEAKSTRNYFIIDAIANFAKNTGRSLGNIGAQYSGGTIDEGHDSSQWENIRNTLGSEELQVAKEQLGGPAERRATSELLNNKLTALSANRSATVNDLINEIRAAADEAKSETMKKSYLALAAQLAGAGMNNVSLGASAATGLIEDIRNWVKGDKE